MGCLPPGACPGLFLGTSFHVARIRLTLAGIFLLLLPPLSYSPLPDSSSNTVVHIAHFLKLNYSRWPCLSTRSGGYVQSLPPGQWGNVSCCLDSTTTHTDAWGPQVTKHYQNKLPDTFSAHDWHYLKGPLFLHVIDHLHATFPFCITSQRSEGTPVGSLNPNQCQWSFIIPHPPLRNVSRLSLTWLPSLGVVGTQNPGDEPAFLHIHFPLPATLTGSVPT